MPLAPGTRLGAYEILAAIGAGGMGEVYKARDARLDRDVAVKVLPQHMGADSELHERFRREARALATLSHPHICSIFDVGSHDGIDFLVMEYLEGDTLVQRLERGALPIDQVLRHGIEMADALDKAHRRGIVHRDLKPGNILLTKSGVKLLDFGLAKLQLPGPVGGASVAATMTTPLTGRGTILGTLHYMAPEQLEGGEADARSDIFAFGATMYEMVTGRRAFDGKSQASIISAIMSSDPPPASSLQPLAPPTLDQLIRTCLAKDPDDRWQTAGDIQRQLKWIADGRSSVSAATAALPPVRRRHTRTLVAAAAGCVAGALAAAIATQMLTRPAPAEPQRVSIVLPADRPLAFGWTPGSSLAIAPDGLQIVYVGRVDLQGSGLPGRALHVRSLRDRTVRALPGTEGAGQPFFSPDGQWVAFFGGTEPSRTSLKKISLAGGAAITLVENVNGGVWGFGTFVDASTIVFTIAGTLWQVSSDGGVPRQVTSADGGKTERYVDPVLIDGTRNVMFTVHSGPDGRPRTDVVMLDSGERRTIVEHGAIRAYLASGHVLFQRDGATLVAPFDRARLALAGSAVPLADEPRMDGALTAGPVAQFTAASSGTLAYVPAAAQEGLVAGLLARGGVFEPLKIPEGAFGMPRISPDGRSVAIEVRRRGAPGSEVHIHDITRGTTTRLTQEGSDSAPAWRPNSSELAVTSTRGEARGIFLKNLNGAERLLVSSPPGVFLRNASWSPDGRFLAYTAQSVSQHDVWITDAGEKPSARPLLNGPASEHSPRFSPDGRWLAYVSDESGRSGIFVRRFPDGESVPVWTQGGTGPAWSGSGREIFFQAIYEGSLHLMSAALTVDGDTVKPGVAKPLVDMSTTVAGSSYTYAGSNNFGAGYDVFPDGQRFVVIRGPDPEDSREIVLVQNFFEEVRRLTSPR